MRAIQATVIFAGLAVALVGWTAHAQGKDERAQTQICTLKVTGMTCGGCEAAVKIAARKIDGVKTAKVSYKKGTAEIMYDPAKTNPEAIAAAITRSSGFQAEAPRKDGKQ